MPQFDFYSFSSQNFWILLSFFIVYFFILYCYLSNFSELLKFRQKLILFYTSGLSTIVNFNTYEFFYKV